MKRFKLQTILDYRKLRKDLIRQELCDSIKRETALIAEIRKEQEELDKLCRDLNNRRRVGITPHELLMYENRCSYKAELVGNIKRKLEVIQNEITDQRRTLCEADRDEKLLERLKEKQMLENKRLLQKKETTETDEIAVRTYKR